MHHDLQQEAGSGSGHSGRHHERKEWGSARETQHQMEAREHARQHGRSQRTHDLRDAEAQRQIRELRQGNAR